MTQQTAQAVDGVRMDFAEFIRQQRDGDCAFECAAKMERLIEAVREKGAAGEFTLKIEVKPSTAGDGTQVLITDHPKIKVPDPKRKPSLFFTTQDNGLSRRNPNQLRFEDRAETDEDRQAWRARDDQ